MTSINSLLLTDRGGEGETMGVWRRPGWRADVRFFRCTGPKCAAVIPESDWEGADVEAQLCRGCAEARRKA